jgi:hypothetical protein
LLLPRSKAIKKPRNVPPKSTGTDRRTQSYRPRRGNYTPTTSPNAQKEGFPGNLLSQASIPRTTGNLTRASTLRRLVPGVLQDSSNVGIEKWVETCKEYGAKVYNQGEPPGIPETEGRMRDGTESRASTRGQTNKQHESAMQHMPTTEYRQYHNDHDDFQDTDSDADTPHSDMSSQNFNLY